MKNVIKRIIADFHQGELPSFRRRELVVPYDLERIITIIGPRRAGKTTYMFQVMSDLEGRGISRQRMLYLNFEDERLVFEGDNDVIFDAYREMYPDQDMSQVYLFFDEIQELPNWEKFVRRVSDSLTRHIFLTGSNATLLSREIATALRGRSLAFEILTLSFREYCAFQDISLQDRDSSHGRALINNAFEQYSQWGGFPEIVTMDERIKARVLQEYLDIVLYRDLIERYEIRDTTVVKYILKRLINSFTREFSINKLYNELKSKGFSIGKDTLYERVGQLLDIYMLCSVERYDPSVVRREMSNKKVYLYDNGLASAVRYFFSEDRGKRLENIVFRQLRQYSHEILFAKNGWECDFVTFDERGHAPRLIQVVEHLDQETAPRELKGLEAARKLTGAEYGMLLVDDISRNTIDPPSWITVMSIRDWLLDYAA